ncbi:MAG: restriction endonuclease subunit S [Rhodospirillaceae bacterium]|nr:restriction endonuclease subunit S [Rhodospirillaceae bacterium]
MTAHTQVPLGEICKINPRAQRHGYASDTLVSFVPMAAVDERLGAIAIREDRSIADVSKGYTPFQDGDVLFAKITPCMENGKAAIARDLTNGMGSGSTEFYVLRPDGKVLGEYIYHFVRQPQFRETAKRNFTGTAGQQRVPKSFMEEVLIPLPPLDDQQRIVGILNRAAKIERMRTRARELMGEFISALFVRMFGRQDQVGVRYPCRPLREVAEIRSGVTKGRKIEPANAIEVPYLRVANVQDGYLSLDEIKTIIIRRGEERKYALAQGDLVMTEGGDPDKLGRAAIWNGELDYCAHQNHVFRVRPDTEVVLTDYLRAVAGSVYGKAYFLSVAKRTTGIASVNKTQLGDFPIPVPPMALQALYSKIVVTADDIASVSETAAREVAAVNASLMNRLLEAVE